MTQLVRGSLQDMAQQSRQPLAKTFMQCECLILIDISGSMAMQDCGMRSRYDVACEQLTVLQRENPGKIAVIAWNDKAIFCPLGMPNSPDGCTNLLGTLEYIKPADGCGLKIVVISDGMPDRPMECLAIASGFQTKLDTIYVGPEGLEGETGRKFMAELARVSGGIAVSQSVKSISILSETVSRLLKA